MSDRGMTEPDAVARHFLADDDLSPGEQSAVLDLAVQMKRDRFGHRPLAGPRTVAVIFDKPSTRTRVSFAVGVAELGGHALVLDSASSQLGRGESVEDTARVLGRQVSAIVWRTFAQSRIEAMAAASPVPVVNALTDQLHPCQLLADLLTVRERLGGLAGVTVAFVGDAENNMAHSWLLGGALAGMHVRVGGPAEHQPEPEILARAKALAQATGGSATATTVPEEAFANADVVVTDTWVSMGQEADQRRLSLLEPWSVTTQALAAASRESVVLHCLPAYRDQEIAAEVLDGPRSAVWDEAENRLHAQKALLAWLLRAPGTPTRLAAGAVEPMVQVADTNARYGSGYDA